MNTQVSLDVDFLADMPAKTMLALVAKHKEAKKFFEQAQRAIKDFPSLFLLLEEMDVDVRFDPDMKLLRVSFTGDGLRLGKVWGELRRHGFTCDQRPKKGDTEFNGWFDQEGYSPISIHFTSTMCRRVQVGTKTVEQPIYETICGEELSIAAEARPTLTVVNGDENEIPF